MSYKATAGIVLWFLVAFTIFALLAGVGTEEVGPDPTPTPNLQKVEQVEASADHGAIVQTGDGNVAVTVGSGISIGVIFCGGGLVIAAVFFCLGGWFTEKTSSS